MRIPAISCGVAALVALTHAGLAAAEGEVADVPVGAFSIAPLANPTFVDDRLVVHPKLALGVGYDSNVLTTASNQTSDVFYRAMAGVYLTYRLDEARNLSIDGEADTTRYADNDQLNLNGGRGVVDYIGRSEVSDSDFNLRYGRSNDPLPETGELIKRDTYDAKLDYTYKTLYSRYSFGAAFSRTDFLTSSRLFDAQQADNDNYEVSLAYGVAYARDSVLALRLTGLATRYDQHDLYNDSNGGSATIDWSRPLGERSAMGIEAGLIYRNYSAQTPTTVIPPGDFLAPTIDIHVDWPWEEGSALHAKVFSHLENSFTGNAAVVYGAGLGVNHRPGEHINLTAGAEFTEARSHASSLSTTSEIRDTGSIQAGATYQVRRGFAVALTAGYTDSASNIDVDYQRWVVELAVGFVY